MGRSPLSSRRHGSCHCACVLVYSVQIKTAKDESKVSGHSHHSMVSSRPSSRYGTLPAPVVCTILRPWT